MPHYEIHHSLDIPDYLQAALAAAITDLHCTLFNAPSMFVNVTFHFTCFASLMGDDDRRGDTQAIFVGGKKHMTNYIHAHLRPRGDREKLDLLVKEITKIWNKHARTKHYTLLPKSKNAQRVERADEDAPGRLDDPRALHNIFIFEDIAAGAEQGFLLPVAGKDREWVQENMGAFGKRAAEGDESMVKLLDEVKGGLGKGEVTSKL